MAGSLRGAAREISALAEAGEAVAGPIAEDVQFFRESQAEVVAEAVLGLRGATREDAAHALAALCADRAQLTEILAGLPGDAVMALELIARAGRPVEQWDLVKRLDASLGAGRGADAFAALEGSGLLAPGPFRQFEVWKPLAAPILEVFEGLELVSPGGASADAPEAAPDHGALAIALFLGELARRRPRTTKEGGLHRRDANELERRFAGVLGPGCVELFELAFSRLGILAREAEPPGSRGAWRAVVDPAAAAEFLRRPRHERVVGMARAALLPPWLALAFRAGHRLAPREELARAARAWDSEGDPAARWLGYCVATGILEEVGSGYRASPEVRGEIGLARPESGRWRVSPDLEVVVPPDVPPVDVFRLACVAEVAALDRDGAAVLRFTPASLRLAANAGLEGNRVLMLLMARSEEPVPAPVIRAVRDGVRAGAPAAEAAAAAAAEFPPGMLRRLRLDPERHLNGITARALARLLALPPAPPVTPAEERLAAARARARAGNAAEHAGLE